MTINDQIRDAIRRRIRIGERFTIHDLRRRAPELCHVIHLANRLANIARDGFMIVLECDRVGRGNTRTVYLRGPKLPPAAVGGVTVSDWIEPSENGGGDNGERLTWIVEVDDDWRERLADVCSTIGIAPREYIRDLIEADVARRARIAG